MENAERSTRMRWLLLRLRVHGLSVTSRTLQFPSSPELLQALEAAGAGLSGSDDPRAFEGHRDGSGSPTVREGSPERQGSSQPRWCPQPDLGACSLGGGQAELAGMQDAPPPVAGELELELLTRGQAL